MGPKCVENSQGRLIWNQCHWKQQAGGVEDGYGTVEEEEEEGEEEEEEESGAEGEE